METLDCYEQRTENLNKWKRKKNNVDLHELNLRDVDSTAFEDVSICVDEALDDRVLTDIPGLARPECGNIDWFLIILTPLTAASIWFVYKIMQQMSIKIRCTNILG